MRRGIAASPLATYSAGLIPRNGLASGLGNRIWVETFNKDTPFAADAPSVAKDFFFPRLPETKTVAGWRVVSAPADLFSSDQDFKVVGIGTPKAAIVIVTYDSLGTGSPSDNKYISFGIKTASFQGGIGGYSKDNVADSAATSLGFTGETVHLPKTTSTCWAAGTAVLTTDGITISWTTQPVIAFNVYVILFFGPDLQVAAGNVTPAGAALVNTTFAPDVLLALSNVDAIDGTLRTDFNFDTFLGVRTGGTNYSYFTRTPDSAATSAVALRTNDANTIAVDMDDTSQVGSPTLFASWATNGFNISGSGTPPFIYLALNFGGKEVRASVLTTPAATGVVNYVGSGITPAYAFTMMSRLAAWPSNANDDKAGAYGFSAFNAAGESFAAAVADQDNQATMNTASVSAASAYRMPTDAAVAENTASFVSFAPNVMTLNFSAQVTGMKFVTLLVERDFHYGPSAGSAGHVTTASTGKEVFRGTAGVSAGHVLIASTGKEVFRGTAAGSAGHVSISASGLEVFRGTSALSAGHVSAASSGLEVFRGTAAGSAGHVSISASELEVFRGSSNLVGPHVTTSAAALEVFRGTAAGSAGHVSISASGEAAFVGTADVSAGHVSISASGLEVFRGTSALSGPHVSASASGLEVFRGACSLPGPHPSCASASLEVFRGACDLSGPHVSIDAIGHVSAGVFIGTADLSGPHPALSAAGRLVFRGACAFLGPHPLIAASDLNPIGCISDLSGSEDAVFLLGGSWDAEKDAQGSHDAVAVLAGSMDAASTHDGSYDAERDLRGSNC